MSKRISEISMLLGGACHTPDIPAEPIAGCACVHR
jgi:hypothetical protein